MKKHSSAAHCFRVWLVSHILKFGDASKSPSGDTASPAGDVVASPGYEICDTAVGFVAFRLSNKGCHDQDC
jgi:hypothetical protein